mgnify:CR=1 FL=1
MKTVEALLSSEHKQTVFNVKCYSSALNLVKQDDILKQFNLILKNDLDFFRYQIILEGMKNKQLFESTYDRIRNENFDLWEYISFKERKKLVLLAIEPLKESMKSFLYDEQIIFIPFFNVLMNSLYDKEMPIFELPQFLKMYKVFKQEIIDIDLYGQLPYLNGFCDCDCIYHDDSSMILWNSELLCFYQLTAADVIRLPMDQSRVREEQLNKPLIIDFLLHRDEDGLINYVCNCDFVSSKLKKKLLKYLKQKNHA